MEKNQQIAASVLELVGGKENISFVTHCMTRLRLNLKDESIVDDEKVKKIKGVLGIAHSGGQYQIIIGQNVPKVYKAVCETGGFQQEAAIEENLDQPKEKLTLKTIGSNIMNYMSGSMTQLIPGMIAAAMFKTVLVVLGPDMLNLIGVESDAYILLDFVYDAFFYFLPVFLGYTAAKKLGANVVLGMMMGTILLVPDFVALVGSKETLTVYGVLNAPVASYGQSVLPVLLAVWIMGYVEKGFKKIVPDVLSTVFVPTFTLAVMVPVLLCICAPFGSYVGDFICNGLITFGNFGGFLAIAVIGALWEFLVMSGMHPVLIMFAMTTMMETGKEAFLSPAATAATFAAIGMALGAFFKQKNKEEKAESIGYFVSGIVGGVTELVLFGVGFRYKKPFIAMAIGGFVGALYAGIFGVYASFIGATNFMIFLGYVAGGTSNLVHGIIGGLLALIVSAVATYILGGFEEEDEIEAAEELEPVLEI
ncbi:PTS transporter subunit EIIC [uncultured Dubosiella sp.]|uniref:PTS transporter subunit EIIC n=1 Tax=uncultured Dubosiella sp. TaxID=1937011 RepID=UPI0027316134|nr:PTS transporter subunit EIIC [uncultured Dubosiella sp.]